MRNISVFSILFVFLLLFSSCHSSAKPRVMNPSETYTSVKWSDEELAKPLTVRTVWLLQYSSAHIVRLNKSENPHVHEMHDLIITVLKGRGRVHVKNKTYEFKPGDVIEIPRGFTHWVEKTEPGPIEAYMVSVPPFDPNDVREVNLSQASSVKKT